VAIVEFALAVPVIVVFMLGIIDLGVLWRQQNVTQEAVLTSARTLSSVSKNRYADYEGLRTLSAGLSGLSSATPTKVIVWKANAFNTPPAACKDVTPGASGSYGVPGLCNVYSETQLDTTTILPGFPPTSSSSPTCASGSWDAQWCPTGRINAEGNGDWIGVWVEFEFESVTGIVPGDPFTFSTQAIYRLEPPFVGG
jgi:hypothetical protein